MSWNNNNDEFHWDNDIICDGEEDYNNINNEDEIPMAPKRATSVAEFKVHQHGLALQQGKILPTQFDDNDNNANKILLKINFIIHSIKMN